MFNATFGGAGCHVDQYTITHVINDSNDNELATNSFTLKVIGPFITGTAQVGQTLTADVSTISSAEDYDNATFDYKWYTTYGSVVTRIQGATSSAYTIAAADVGKTIKAQVTVADKFGNGDVLTTKPTATVLPANRAPSGAPAISGTPQVGQTLTVSTSGITDADGLTDTTYTYQWIANDGTHDADIAGPTASTYTLVDNDLSNTIKVKVSFTDGQRQRRGTDQPPNSRGLCASSHRNKRRIRKLATTRRPFHQRHPTSRPNPHHLNLDHNRRRRPHHCSLHLPVDSQRRHFRQRHTRCHRQRLHRDRSRRWQDHQGGRLPHG